jgi:LPPG:FO 2-phospho-L-lactate transferase
LDQCDAVIFCPSNPWVSIDPILAVPSMESALKNHPVMAVSPILGNQTVKGPAAKMFSEMGIKPSTLAVAQHYERIIDTLVIDIMDRGQEKDIQNLGIHTLVTNILMKDKADRGRLAKEITDYITNHHKRDSQ